MRRTDEDDIQRMPTQVYRESEYKVGRRDPVIVPYIIQKNMLLDFKKDVDALFDDFAGKVLPPLQAETGKLERRQEELMELAGSTAADIVRDAGEKFNRHMEEKSRAEIDAAVSRHLEKLTEDLRNRESALVEKLEEQHAAFEDTAKQFIKIVAQSHALLLLFSVGAYAFWKWFG